MLGVFKITQNILPHKSYFSLYNFMKLNNNSSIKDWHISWGVHDNI